MTDYLLLATADGLGVYARAGQAWRALRQALAGREVLCVIAREGVILAGSRQGVWRSDDLGESWREASAGLAQRHVRWLAYHPDVSDFELAGTEPAGIFVSRDGAANWRECPEVGQLRDEHHWFLPYSPAAGCVRGFAFHGRRAYAAVEVGGVLRSDDGAQTWHLAAGSDGNPDLDGPPEPLIYPDLHSIHVHSSSPDRVYAPTGGGFYRSDDGGAHWRLCYDCYCRACWVDPADSEHILLGPADNVERNGRIEASRDGGRTWSPASGGLDVPWPHNMVERFVPDGENLLAVLNNGELLRAQIARWAWQPLLPEAGHVHAVSVLSGEI
jgi:photosystem II stability/assembly factor-like uncharacterized protein